MKIEIELTHLGGETETVVLDSDDDEPTILNDLLIAQLGEHIICDDCEAVVPESEALRNGDREVCWDCHKTEDRII